MLHAIPLGGEDLARYVGSPRLVRATGTEPFDTVAAGEPVVEPPEVGEVVWCDDAGVTCRRWNPDGSQNPMLSCATPGHGVCRVVVVADTTAPNHRRSGDSSSALHPPHPTAARDERGS